jgi:15-cis-phytoene synthase
VVHTARSFDLDPDCFRRFLRAMTNSLTVTSYDTFEDLLDYLDGSAAVIGEMLLPILEPRTPSALPYARDFAVACRLTECWSDVGRDLERGRVYVPQEDLRHFGTDPWSRRVTPEWRALVAFELRRTREYFASGDRIADELPPASARCVRIVRDVQLQLLDRIDHAGADVFAGRPRVPGWRTAEIVARRSLLRTGAGPQ